MDHELLARAELERRYDRPIPEGLRLAEHLLRQIDIIRRQRADGSFYVSLVADLRYYRDGWRQWHRRLRVARVAAAHQK